MDSQTGDFREWLRAQLKSEKQRNPRRSLRAFSKKLGISPSTVSEILSGRRTVSEKNARRIASAFQLSVQEQQSMLRSIALGRIAREIGGITVIEMNRDLTALKKTRRRLREAIRTGNSNAFLILLK